MITVDADAVHRAVEGDVSEPVYSGFLFVIALGLATLWLVEIGPAILAGTAPLLVEEVGPQAMVSHFVDLAVVVPALVIAGCWLWQGRKRGLRLRGRRVGVRRGSRTDHNLDDARSGLRR